MRTVLTGLLSALLPLMPVSPVAARPVGAPMAVNLSIDLTHPSPKIEPEIYGQFAEHLGRGIYGGIWVGEDSAIPNVKGYRSDVLNALRHLKVPVIRWPGGCFADQYDWRDGIGPRADRPRRINTIWGGPETNAFGTHEFLDFAELIGAKAYVAGNMGSMEPLAMARWLEYMTAVDDSALTRERRANGREKPWKVSLFGVGNETWGCGGNMTGDYSAQMHRRYASYVRTNPGAVALVRVAGGASSDDIAFTESLMRDAKDHMEAISLHHYTLPSGSFGAGGKGPALGFDQGEWASTLAQALRMETIIEQHSAVMDRYDPEKRVALYIDEWGTWYDSAPGRDMGALYQQNSLRDALVASVTLNIFHKHTDRVKLAAIAQMVNVLQAMILTDGTRMVLTPTYHIFAMYKPFQGATPYTLTLDKTSQLQANSTLPMVSASAARGLDGKLWLALANLDPIRSAEVATGQSGIAKGHILTGPALDTHNSFDQPSMIVPRDYVVGQSGKPLRITLPAKSVVVVAIE